MVTNAELHAVLGASGGTGSAVVREVAQRGHQVRAINRGGDADVLRERRGLALLYTRPKKRFITAMVEKSN
jgi:nucleoside-diphosphate-sugar epimerase